MTIFIISSIAGLLGFGFATFHCFKRGDDLSGIISFIFFTLFLAFALLYLDKTFGILS